ncbi:MAG: tetratricopeptide repeat protein [Firmicutes bacterium]|nr:tetratricopeptide repeat protein [Bacillota bacterium]MCL5040840.1 tetratricopeptide repeat protein [Bacillota bacterium]
MSRRDSPAQERMERALQLKRDRRWAEAETLLLEVLTLEPGNLFARVLLGDIYLGQNRSQEAEKVADELLGIRPDYGAGLVLKGRILFEREEYQQALSHLEAALVAKEDDYLRLLLARTYLKLEQYERAREVAEAVKTEGLKVKRLEVLAEVHRQQGQTEWAMAAYQEILRLSPNNRFIRAQLLRLKTERNDPARAASELGRMTRVAGYADDPYLHILRGDKLRESGQLSEALTAYRQARSLAPGNLKPLTLEAYTLTALGRDDEAIPLLAQALEKDPEDYHIRSAYIAACGRRQRLAEARDFLAGLAASGHPKLWGMVKKLNKKMDEKERP